MIITEIKFGGVKYPCRMVKGNQDYRQHGSA